jgi:hypothetical protein
MSQVQQFTVRADAETGEWIGEPEYVADVDLAQWLKKQDTDAAHFDTYEVDAGDKINTVTRAIEVVWAPAD